MLLHVLLVVYLVGAFLAFLVASGHVLYHSPASNLLVILLVAVVVGALWPVAASACVFAWVDKKEKSRGSANSTA